MAQKTHDDGLGVWQWKNLRDFGVGFQFWPFDWLHFEFTSSGDRFGAQYVAHIGPFVMTLDVNDGSIE